MLTREELEQGYNEAVALATDRFGQIKELIDKNATLRDALVQADKHLEETVTDYDLSINDVVRQREALIQELAQVTAERDGMDRLVKEYQKSGMQPFQQQLATVTAERDKACDNKKSYQGLLGYAQEVLKGERHQLATVTAELNRVEQLLVIRTRLGDEDRALAVRLLQHIATLEKLVNWDAVPSANDIIVATAVTGKEGKSYEN